MNILVSGVSPNKTDQKISLQSVRVGCAGWGIPRQVASEFPCGPSHLARYSQVLSCCEINSSFYRLHKVATWQRWAASVPSDFRFSVKVPKTITHESKLNCRPELLRGFLQQIEHLKEKLGPILIQLPPSLEFDGKLVGTFFSGLRRCYLGGVVCEPRHSSWFTDQADRALRDFEVGRVASDPACVPIGTTPGGLATLVYFRLHGSPRRYYSTYAGDFLDKLSEQLTEMVTRAEVWCVFDNTASGAAASNAAGLKARLEEAKIRIASSR